MKDVILGLVGVGRIGVMHANNIASLNDVLNPQGINVRLRLTDVAEDHARSIAAGLGAESPRMFGEPTRRPNAHPHTGHPVP